MKILFAYFGQPRYVTQTIENHIVVMKQMTNHIVSPDPTTIDIGFFTAPIEDEHIDVIDRLVSSHGFRSFYNFVTDEDKHKIAYQIHKKLKIDFLYPSNVLMLFHQIISIHKIASMLPAEYDAIYVMRTDILYQTYKNNIDYSFLQRFVETNAFDSRMFVTNMNYVISSRMPMVHVNDKMFLTNSHCLKKLYLDDFQENVISYIEDSYAIWKEDMIHHINDYHQSCIRFASNSFMANKLKDNDDYFTIEQYIIAPPSTIVRKKYNNATYLNAGDLNKIIEETTEYDKTHHKVFDINYEWFSD